MPHEISRKRRILYFSFFSLLFVVCIPIIILYSLGYAIDSTTLGLTSRGGVYVLVTEPGITIYIGDDVEETTGIFNKEVFVKDLKPKDYLVVAGGEDFWPWAKIVNVKEGGVSALYPLLVHKTLSFKEILKTDNSYPDVLELFSTEPKTTSPSPVTKIATSTNLSPASSTILAKAEGITKNRMKIWKEGNQVFATWLGSVERLPQYFCNSEGECTDTIVVFESATPIGRMNFYPDRDDAIMLILDRGIYVMEIDVRQYHNFYPIYKGNNPDFRIDGNLVYIEDEASIFSVEL